MTAPPRVDCSLYRFTVWDPYSGYTSKRCGYVGETGRLPIERLVEHLRARYPWGDTVVGWEVDDRSFASKGAVLAAERAAVQAERPLYNAEWNGGNPDRIPYGVQVRQRHARDDAAGRPRWRPGQRPVSVRRPPAGLRVPRRSMANLRAVRVPRWLCRAAAGLVLWLMAVLLVWWRLPEGLGWLDGAWLSSAVASLAVGAVLPRRRRRR